MAWADVLTRGSGQTEYRLVIEGYQTEWVTTAAIAGSTSHGRTRRVGLKREGLVISDRIVPAESSLEGSGMTVSIVDLGGYATTEFAKRAADRGVVADDVTVAATTITVVDSAQLTIGDYIHINTECLEVTAKTATTIDVTRARRDTIAQKHFSYDSSERAVDTSITLTPYSLRGRRAFLYAYGDGETGDGSLIWRGVISAPPRRESVVKWTIAIDPISAILDQEMGAVSALPAHIRGIYYPWTHGLALIVGECSGAAMSATGASSLANYDFVVTGFFETADVLAASLQTLIGFNFGTTAPQGTYSVYAKNNRVRMRIRTGATPRYPLVAATVSGARSVGESTFPSTQIQFSAIDAAGNNVTTVAASTEYEIDLTPIADRLTAPYAWIGGDPKTDTSYGIQALSYINLATAATTPLDRIHIDRNLTFAVGDFIEISNITFGQSLSKGISPNRDMLRFTENGARLEVHAVDTASNWVRVSIMATGVNGPGGPLNPGSEIRKPLVYGTDTDVNGFKEALVASGVNANGGDHPFIRSDDVDDWSTVVTAATNGFLSAKTRRYVFNDAAKVIDVLRPDLQLIGCFLTLNTEGQIIVQQLLDPVESTGTSSDVTSAEIIVSKGFPSWDMEADGIYNLATIQTGYDSFSRSYTGPTYTVRETRSIGLTKTRRVLELAMQSESTGVVSEGEDYLYNAVRLLSMFSRPYYVVQVQVPLTRFVSATLGSTVLLTSAHIPDPTTGTLGIVTWPCMVVGRDWDLDRGIGDLTLYMFDRIARGYAPAARIDNPGSSSLGGNQYLLATTSNYYSPTGRIDASYFAVGDKVNVQFWDQGGWTYEEVSGTIDAINTVPALPTVTVTFASAMPVGWPGALTANVYVLKFDIDAARDLDVSSTAITSNMRRFAYVADKNRKLYSEATDPEEPVRLSS